MKQNFRLLLNYSLQLELIFQTGKIIIITIAGMDFFKCCKTVESGHGYEVLKRGSKNEKTSAFFSSLDDIPKNDLINRNSQVLKVQKSDYNQLMKQLKETGQKWTDPVFPPSEDSLGKIPGITTNKWKRLSDMLNKPALFDGRIEPKDVVQGGLDDCYFLSALAALAERQEYIKTVFRDQAYNPSGIYKVALKIDGEITEILVDDYVPVNNNGEPLFSQPYKNQFWVLILEKAWAKIHGSYSNIVAGNPCQILKAVSYAPTETHFIKGQEENEKIWRNILNQSKRNYPCCCGTAENEEIDWENIGLIENHSYTLVHAAELKSKGKVHRVLQLRNAWNKAEWEGEASEKDKNFWQNVEKSQEKDYFLRNFNQEKDGIFFMTFNDFCRYFSQVHFCLAEENAHYLSQNLYINKKNGSLFEFQVQKPGLYLFELHQSISTLGFERNEEDICRSTILLAKVTKQNDYEFIDGTLKYNDKDTTLKANLVEGKYILYAKLDPSRAKGGIPEKSNVSSYSSNFLTLQTIEQKSHPNLLKKMFLNHAKFNKRQTYNNGLMWIAWKLLYQQGGYAYIAFGNSAESNKKFVITFDQEQFDKLHFKLKKNFKRKGNGQVLQVLPSQEEIILARVKNQIFKGLKFPPQIGIKLEPLSGQSHSQHH